MAGTPEQPPQKRIFDRRREKHPWEKRLAALETETEWGRSTVARNWRMDHRVEAGREEVMIAAFEKPTPPGCNGSIPIPPTATG